MVAILFRDPQARSSALATLGTQTFGSLNRVETLDSVSNYYSVFLTCTQCTSSQTAVCCCLRLPVAFKLEMVGFQHAQYINLPTHQLDHIQVLPKAYPCIQQHKIRHDNVPKGDWYSIQAQSCGYMVKNKSSLYAYTMSLCLHVYSVSDHLSTTTYSRPGTLRNCT